MDQTNKSPSSPLLGRFRCDPEGKNVILDDDLLAMLRCEGSPRSLIELFVDADAGREILEVARNVGWVFGARERLVRDGETFWGELFIHAESEGGSSASRLEGAVRDVTPSIVTNEELRRARDLLASAERIAKLGSWSWEIETDQLRWSKQMYAIFGVTEDQRPATYADYLQRIHPDDRGYVDRIVRRLMEDGKGVEFEHRVVLPDETEKFLRCHAEADRDSGGSIVRLLGTAHDMTEKRLLQEALHEREVRLRLLMERLPAIVWSTDRDLRVTSASGAGLRALGVEAHQVIGMMVHEYLRSKGEEDDQAGRAHIGALEGEMASFETDIGDRTFFGHVEPLRRLDGSIAGTIGVALDISERRVAEQQVEYQAYHDLLTGLENREYFRDRAELAIARGRRHGFAVGVLMIDLDEFKLVNETLGHSVGDDLLRLVADRLSGYVRETDSIGGAGGDKFLVLASQMTSPDDSLTIADTLLTALSTPFDVHEKEIYCTASIGVAIFPDDGDEVDGLISAAESAMLRVKSTGGNSYELSHPTLSRQATKRLAIANALHGALDREEMVLHYQPIVDLGTDRIAGAEALLRWRRDGGIVTPDEFIKVAEETRLIVPIGDWVLRKACTDARRWIDRGHYPFRIAVNLSARQFQQRTLADRIGTILDEAGLSPDCLELEITESMALRDVSLTAHILERLRDLGVRIAMDDFGTGFSSLSYLKSFPVTSVKIDRGFVTDLMTDVGDEAIVTAVIALSHSLGLRVTAEGVETQAQLEFLKERGCDEMQGYLFSSPVDVASFEGMLEKNS